MTLYTDFVKIQMSKMDKSIPVTDRMKMIGKLYQETKDTLIGGAYVKKIKTGLSKTATDAKERAERQLEKRMKKLDVKPSKPKTAKFKATKRVTTLTEILDSDDENKGGSLKLNRTLQNQLIVKGSYHGGAVVETPPPSNIDSYYVYPIPSNLQGLPTYLLQHPNKYSNSKSQGMIYSSFENFVDTDFYSNNKINLKTITPPPQFARSSSTDPWLDHVAYAFGKKLRIIFTQGNLLGQGSIGVDNNFNAYYIDSANIDDYVNLLSQIYKDRDIIQPVEAAAILRMARNASEAQGRYIQTQGDYSRGASDQRASDAQAQAEAEASSSDDSSSIWGDIGSAVLTLL